MSDGVGFLFFTTFWGACGIWCCALTLGRIEKLLKAGRGEKL